MDAENSTIRVSAAARSRRSSSSMSHRLEEIVAQLMRPIHNLRQNFDMDLSLLEEYLTEMGLRRLSGAPEDFATIAMLVQQCAHIYGKKVDFYEQSVFDMVEKSELTHSQLQSQEDSSVVESEAKSGKKRKRRHSGAFRDFGPIDLEPAPNISRQSEPVRQPPTLPKTYIEFERPPLGERDARLYDYAGCEIGVAADYHVNWNMRKGMIVDHLDSSAAINREMVVPIVVAVMDEMRRLSPPMSGSDSGIEQPDHHFETPIQKPLDDPAPTPKSRKRKEHNVTLKEVSMSSKKKMTVTDLKIRSFCNIWKRVGEARCGGGLGRLELQALECGGEFDEGLLVKALRKLCVDSSLRESYSFKGYSSEDILQDRLGMLGFTSKDRREVEERRSLHPCSDSGLLSTPSACLDSDDDGFFEMSDASTTQDVSTVSAISPLQSSEPDRTTLTGRVEEWHALIGPRVAAAEARPPFDAHACSARVLAKLHPAAETTFRTVLSRAKEHDVCRYFLATLFLANTRNVEIVKNGPPLSLGFNVKLLTRDKTLFASSNPFE